MTRIETKRGLLLIAGLLLLPAGFAVADWGFQHGDEYGTNRASGVGQISNSAGRAPAFAWSIEREPTRLEEALLRDYNGDGEPEVLIVASGAITALNPQTGQAWWTSPFQGIDSLIGAGDVDGNPATTELLASSNSAAGALHFIDAPSGGLQGAISGLPDLSGVDAREVVLYDLDDDGVDEIIHPAGLYGLGSLFVSDPSAGLTNPSRLEVPLYDYTNMTPPRVGDLLGTGTPAIAVNQGNKHALFTVCEPTDAGASCDDGPGTLCLCSQGVFWLAHPLYSFGPSWTMDVDGDGTDEVVEVPNNARYTRAVSVLDFADGMASGTPDVAATRQWYRRYMGTEPAALLEPLQEGPLDLDGDGDLEIVVSFVNNDGNDTDSAGTTPNEDGIDHPNALSIGVFDATNGDLLVSVLDAVAYGTVDLDGDGTLELVTSPATAGTWTYEEGLTGLEMDCSAGPCTLDPAWAAPDRTLEPNLEELVDLRLPAATVHTVNADSTGPAELLVYFDGDLEAITADGAGGFTTVVSRTLQLEEELVTSDPETNTALLSTESEATVVDRGLLTIGAPIPLFSRDWTRFAAASFDGGVREAPVFDGGIFQTSLEPSTMGDADHELLPDWAMATDLDGDGTAEAVSYRNAGLEEPSFEIRVDRWNDSTSEFDEVWTFDSASEAQLTGFGIGRSIHFAHGDFDNVGSRDVVLSAGGAGEYHLLVLDGDTGALDHVFDITLGPAAQTPVLVADMVDATGAAGTDGIDDVVVPSQSLVEVLSIASGLLSSVATGFPHVVGAYGDVDSDGDVELVSTISVSLGNKMDVLDIEGPGPATYVWGPQDLDLQTGSTQVMAMAEIDDNAGLDILYTTAAAALLAIRGDTGDEIRAPLYLSDGGLSTSPTVGAAGLLSLLVLDVDDDGYEEAIVGSLDGWIYAIDVDVADPAAPGLAWAIEAASAVRALAAADTDGDGYDEILVSTDNGLGSVIDGVGADLTIEQPVEGDCIPSSVFEVSGTALGLSTVEIFFGGSSISGDVDASSGTWAGDAEARAPGAFLLEARGKDASGVVALVATKTLQVGADLDEDGWFACADCDDDDPDRSPGTEEICEDGIDQDCDGEDLECEDPTPGDDDDDDDDSTAADDDDTGDDDDTTEPGGCADGCEGCASGGSAAPGVGWLLAGVLVLGRRRRR